MEFIDTIARMMQIRSYQPGDHIIRQNEDAKAMFFLIRGNVDVVSEDHEIIFASLAHPSYCITFNDSSFMYIIIYIYIYIYMYTHNHCYKLNSIEHHANDE